MTVNVLQDMAGRYLLALRPAAPWAVPACLLALAFLVAQRSHVPDAWKPSLRRLSLFAIVTLALVYGWQLRWIGDDAFISFRYAENLARGVGLVFNPGERVEGYTNFLWTVLISGAIALGFDPVQTSVVLGGAAFAALLWLTTRVARQTAPEGTAVTVSLAAMACGAQYLMASFMTSGLETMLGSALVMAALERAIAGATATAGLLAVLATMNHPDHALFYAALFGALVLDPAVLRTVRRPSKEALRAALMPALRFVLPFVLVFVPYFIWRCTYYGDIFPNTYYAKSANVPYYSQGAVFACATLIGTGLWAVLPFSLYGLWTARTTLFGRFCALAIPVFTFYVIKVGGDFMYGRLFCPLIAPVLLLAERAIRQLCSRAALVRAAVALLALCVSALPVRLLAPFEKHWMLADERTFYRLESFDPVQVKSLYFDWAKTILEYFPRHAPRPWFALQSVGIISYYTGLPILDCFGLADKGVARRPIKDRGRPGHEKGAAPAYIVERGADISETPIYPSPYAELSKMSLGGLRFHVVRYDPKLFDPLRKRHGVRINDIPKHLERLSLLHVSPSRREEAACDAWFAEEMYFSRVPGDPLRARFTRNLLDAGRPDKVKETDPALYTFETTHRPDPETAFHFDREELARFHKPKKGTRAGFGVTETKAPQGTTKNQRGAFLDTFLAKGDDSVAKYRSFSFPLRGDVLELWIGGGRLRPDLRVSLLVNRKRVFSSGGCQTEMLGRRLWQITRYKGERGILEIVDESKAGWGHLLVDEVVQWVRK